MKDSSASSQAGMEPTMSQEQAQVKQPQGAVEVAKVAKVSIPPTRIGIDIQGKNGFQIHSISLLDRGVMENLMSYQTWCYLGKILHPSL